MAQTSWPHAFSRHTLTMAARVAHAGGNPKVNSSDGGHRRSRFAIPFFRVQREGINANGCWAIFAENRHVSV
ncbi:hypothetical protein [uncultured Bifidobacterium sp.]|uniref:hypothetical protein n=1 Tax=uncultured Bifidobacterium sp. TaxID=165187 RepID=UPI0025927137|nr:hypothetical protein [uncultured Bifidobacterium sp.]